MFYSFDLFRLPLEVRAQVSDVFSVLKCHATKTVAYHYRAVGSWQLARRDHTLSNTNGVYTNSHIYNKYHKWLFLVHYIFGYSHFKRN